ncbi:hypothetical protein KTE26_11550 [Ralstonia mannitolilytica]|uniref:hypothetical protein n=1 Tax=Ralstonia mannitolilytica TaxID=105219 RepID=UPI000CEF4BC3|nr:hypothetical protein [Ralstonia mannitolilytica]MBU9579066.1 hypothetical protein [Ralstonia mannitolilytica]
MIENRTKPLNRELLLQELEFVIAKLAEAGVGEVQLSFGWDCNLDIDDMWQEQSVRVDALLESVIQAEQSGIVEVGRGDIFVKTYDFELTLCHEADAHVGGAGDLVRETIVRWQQLGYEPYEVAAG